MFIKMRPTALGAITQLYAGTTPDAKEVNGKVSVIASFSSLLIQSVRSILFHGHELARPEKTLWTKSWARSCFLGSGSKLLRRYSRYRRHDLKLTTLGLSQLSLIFLLSSRKFIHFALFLSSAYTSSVILVCFQWYTFWYLLSLASESNTFWFRCVTLYLQ